MASPRAPIELFAVHGGRLDRARAAFPQVADWTDLSTGIAPWRYPLDLDAAGCAPLPDPAALADLESVAARCFGTVPEQVAAVPGTDLALRLLGALLPGAAAWAAPGYSGHRLMWPAVCATPFAPVDLPAAADRAQTIVLARPNNPDGWAAGRATLAEMAQRLSARGGQLIVDEAFADATPDDSLAGCDWPGLIVLRSFGKFFGLAGLRLGFVIAAPGVIARLRALLGDWPVSAPALAAGRAAYADIGWQHDQRDRLDAASKRMAALLTAHGLVVHGWTPFFILIDYPERDALFDHLLRAGVLTRPFADQPGWLRIGLPGKEADWTRLADALADGRIA